MRESRTIWIVREELVKMGSTQSLRRISDRLSERVRTLNRRDVRRLASEEIQIMLSDMREEIRDRKTMPLSTTVPERTAA